MGGTGSIVGRIVDQRNSQALAGATCTVSDEGIEKNTTSNENGEFRIADLLPGSNYELVIRLAGFEQGRYGPLTIFPDVPTNLAVALQPSNS